MHVYRPDCVWGVIGLIWRFKVRILVGAFFKKIKNKVGNYKFYLNIFKLYRGI